MSQGSFSRRYGYAGQPAEITIRKDAPESLRYFILQTAHDLGLHPHPFREITCLVLGERPDKSNWSEYPNVWDEAQNNVYRCPWFQVYDIIERIGSWFKEGDDKAAWEEEKAEAFEKALNDFFVMKGIGWQLENGLIVTRGAEAFEEAVKTAKAALEDSERPTAAKHIHEALQALSRRPDPEPAASRSRLDKGRYHTQKQRKGNESEAYKVMCGNPLGWDNFLFLGETVVLAA